MSWDKQVPNCFATTTLTFANHVTEEDWALEWLVDLRTRGVGWKEVRVQLNAFLQSKGASADAIKKQLLIARQKMKPWLRD